MPVITPTGSGNGGDSSAFARVSLSASIADWDGTPIAFDVIDYDPDGLWDATNHWFAAKAAGWYEVAAYATDSGGGVSIAAVPSNGTSDIVVVVFGAGNNIHAPVGQHAQVTSGTWVFPPLFGHTHLDVADTVDFEGSVSAGAAPVGAGFAFSLRMVTAD